MKKLLVLAWGLLAAGPIFSKVKLPSVLGSNMVLQRECDANLLGLGLAVEESHGHDLMGRSQICDSGRRRRQLVAEGGDSCRRRALYDPYQRRRACRARERNGRRGVDLFRPVEHGDARLRLSGRSDRADERADARGREIPFPETVPCPSGSRFRAEGRLRRHGRLAGFLGAQRARIYRDGLYLRTKAVRDAECSGRYDPVRLGRDADRGVDDRFGRPGKYCRTSWNPIPPTTSRTEPPGCTMR